MFLRKNGPYIALNCVSGNLKFKFSGEEPPDPPTSQVSWAVPSPELPPKQNFLDRTLYRVNEGVTFTTGLVEDSPSPKTSVLVVSALIFEGSRSPSQFFEEFLSLFSPLMTEYRKELPWLLLGSVSSLMRWSGGCSKVRQFEFVDNGVCSGSFTLL